MGTDKGSMNFQDKLWVEVLRDKVVDFSDVFLSLGEHNEHLYSNVSGMTKVLDGVYNNLAGPLKGLMSAKELLKSYEKVLVIPCDMINLSSENLLQMLKSVNSSVYEVANKIEPLPFCLSNSDLLFISQCEHENKSLINVLNSLVLSKLNSEDKNLFLNFNSREDLRF